MAREGEKILVSVRVRPRNDKEKTRNDICDWECVNNTTIICNNNLPERSLFPSTYTFDKVFGFDSPTKQVYEDGAKKVALCVLQGINSSIFAYGQTSSGKTYTMCGITKFAMDDIFCYIEKHKERKFTLKFSAIEIYNEAVRDLLSEYNNQLRLLDDPERGTVVERLIEQTLRDRSHLEELLSVCETQRKIGETSLNETSSRSHQILRLTIESSGREYSPENSSTLAASVCFVDLAGSERASQTLSAGTRLKEGCHINRSLLTLGTVIRKLSKGKNRHIPYRDSKLTRILQNSLGGNARTAIICTMSPARSHVEQSRNTLLFATCAKEVSTNAQVNLVVSEKALVKQLQQELARMENELKNLGSASSEGNDFYLLLKQKEEMIAKMEEQIKELKWQRDVAQSRVENLLKSAAEERSSRTDEQSMLSSIDFDADLRRRSYDSLDIGEPNIINNLSKIISEEDNFLLDDETPQFSRQNTYAGWEEMVQKTDKKVGNACKEVRCIASEGEPSSEHVATVERYDSSDDIVDKKAVSEVLSPKKEKTLSAPEYEQSYKSFMVSEKAENGDMEINAPAEEAVEMKLIPNVAKLEEDKEEKLENKPHQDADRDYNESSNCKNMETDDIDKNTYIALKEKVKKMQKRIEYLMSMQTAEQQLPPSFRRDCMSPELFIRSRSCKENLLSARSPHWFEKLEANMSPAWRVTELKTTPRRPIHTSFDSGSSNSSTSIDARSLKDADPETGDSFNEFVAELEEMARQHSGDATLELDYGTSYSPKRTERNEIRPEGPATSIRENEDTLPNSQNRIEETTDATNDQQEREQANDLVDKTIPKETDSTEACLEKLQVTNGQYSSNFSEFERQQRQIIELWAICNVPLVHRTYFFLLFKGDASDYVYMEVELRRLSFLKQTISNDTGTSRIQTVKTLTREKERLSKQIPKKFVWNKRIELYRKWGVEVNSKKRSLQVAHKLWTNPQDMEHITESASLVAKLIGFVEPSRMPKEMFGLSLLPGTESIKSPGWRFSKSFSGIRLTGF